MSVVHLSRREWLGISLTGRLAPGEQIDGSTSLKHFNNLCTWRRSSPLPADKSHAGIAGVALQNRNCTEWLYTVVTLLSHSGCASMGLVQSLPSSYLPAPRPYPSRLST